MAASPSHSQQEPDDDDIQKQDPDPINAHEAKPPPPLSPQQPAHSETLETPAIPNPPQLPLDDQGVQNPQQPDEEEDTLLVLDGDDHQLRQRSDNQSGTTHLSAISLPEPIVLTDDTKNPPLTSPINLHRRPNKRKKGATRNPLKRKKSMMKVQNLTDILNPIPFKPAKTLDFDKHEEVLKRLGLWDFSKIEFDRSIRTDLVVQLIVNYDSKKRCSYVNDFRILVNRADLARALKLPGSKQEKGSSSVEEVDLDSEVFSDEAIQFIEDFVSSWMLLHEDSWAMPSEIVNWTRCIKDGHPEKLDCANLFWYMVEKELTQGDKLVGCYYASHLQRLIKSQREEVFMSEMEVEEVKEEDDGVADDGVADDGDENVKAEEDKEDKDDKASVVQEHNIELTLGPDIEEVVHEEVRKDDEAMVDADECKEEGVDEQTSWLLAGKNEMGEHFLQRCQSGDLNSYEERKPEEVEDEQIEQVEDEEEEEAIERAEDGFDMEANDDDAIERDGLTDNFLQGVEAPHIPFGSQGELRGISSMDLFGSRDGSFISHGGPSFFSNGGKRVMEPEEDDMHHLDGNNKRLKTDEMWEQKPNDFGLCMEQMQQWMEKAKMIYESKEQSYENSHFNQQLAINQLQERQNYMEIIIKSKDQELEKKHAEVFRLERELYLMGDLLAGYRKALSDTRLRFSEYRKRHALREEPVYKDAGPGGLVLSTRELEKQRLKQEEDQAQVLMLAKNLEEEFVCKLEMHRGKMLLMVDRLVSIENEMKKLKELSAQRKEIQKSRDEQALSAELEESGKSPDEGPENVNGMQSVPPDAAESKETGAAED